MTPEQDGAQTTAALAAITKQVQDLGQIQVHRRDLMLTDRETDKHSLALRLNHANARALSLIGSHTLSHSSRLHIVIILDLLMLHSHMVRLLWSCLHDVYMRQRQAQGHTHTSTEITYQAEPCTMPLALVPGHCAPAV